ncbi:uncharacterized protein LOC130527012 isoform X2 [Takifugu flavidus]|uniref:uncharacterized protein LOC130527012 isoform X2 n=1 Tax=Takifugu flavidus TaxID=433684 RepID=UPI002544B7B5|nr:uncharacterized protein LOC130527012 isoform X2 [Takifugu flavidus]
MDPPSYDDACVVPRLSDNQATNIPPPPSYNACITPSLPPPPTYREAVTTPLDPFPLLIPPRAPTSVTSPPNSDTVVHPLTESGQLEGHIRAWQDCLGHVCHPGDVGVVLWLLSDSVYGAQPTRRPSLLPAVQKASARAQEVTSSHLNLGDVLRRVLCTRG